jgi:hypothetical protein
LLASVYPPLDFEADARKEMETTIQLNPMISGLTYTGIVTVFEKHVCDPLPRLQAVKLPPLLPEDYEFLAETYSSTQA